MTNEQQTPMVTYPAEAVLKQYDVLVNALSRVAALEDALTQSTALNRQLQARLAELEGPEPQETNDY